MTLRRGPWRLLLGLLLLAFALPAWAAEPSIQFSRRSSELVRVLNGELQPRLFFSPVFLAEIPPAQVAAVGARLRSSFGRALSVQRVEAGSPTAGIVFVRFERALVRIRIATGPQPPHLVEGLLVVGAESSASDVAAVFREMAGLPGEVSVAAARL